MINPHSEPVTIKTIPTVEYIVLIHIRQYHMYSGSQQMMVYYLLRWSKSMLCLYLYKDSRS